MASPKSHAKSRTSSKDVGARKAPTEWLDAQRQSPGGGDDSRVPSGRHVAPLPLGQRTSPFTTIGSAVVGGFVGGNVWYWSETLGLFRSAWAAVALGLFIALTARIGGGPGDSGVRAGVAVVVYGLSLAVVLALLTYHGLMDVYGYVDGLADFEQALVRSHFRRVEDLAAYAIGGLGAWTLSMALRRR